MRKEREDYLCSQANSLAMQMAAIHYQKAERRAKVLETSRATVTLHSMLIQLLRERNGLERQEMAQSIQSVCLVGTAWLMSCTFYLVVVRFPIINDAFIWISPQGLEEAQQQLQKERTELGDLEMSKVASNKPLRRDSDEVESDKVFQQDCRMVCILQEALYKCDEHISLSAKRWAVMLAFSQLF